MGLRTFQITIEETTIAEEIVFYKGLFWYNLDYHHPKMHEEDGEPIVKGLINFVMKW